jgi:hypothetical protein
MTSKRPFAERRGVFILDPGIPANILFPGGNGISNCPVRSIMAKNHLLLTISIISLLLFACRRESAGFMGSVDHNSLIGEWKWVMQTNASAINGPPYDTITPASIGILSREMTLTPDSLYTMLTFSASQQQIENGKFKIIQQLTPGGPVKVLDFIHNGIDSTVNHTLRHDSLFISNTLYTGKYTVNVYQRVIPI